MYKEIFSKKLNCFFSKKIKKGHFSWFKVRSLTAKEERRENKTKAHSSL